MADVTVTDGSLPSAVGREGQALLNVLRQWQSIANGRFPNDCSALLQMVDETDRLRLWEKKIGGWTSTDRNDFLRHRVLINFDLTEKALTDIVVRLRRGEKAVLARQLDAAAPDLKPVGRPWPQDNDGNKESVTTIIAHQNDATYAIRRLRKDRPDIHARVLAGEITPHAGMIEAGFRKKRIGIKLTPLDHLQRAWRKASASERVAFQTWINDSGLS